MYKRNGQCALVTLTLLSVKTSENTLKHENPEYSASLVAFPNDQ